MNDKYLKDSELEAMFEAAANEQAVVSDTLLTRIVADADLVATQQVLAKPISQKPIGQNWFANFLKSVGGWPAVGGLVTATVVGLWVGYAPPAAFDGIADTYLATDSEFDLIDFIPSYEAVMGEG